ncbi:tryptophan--tRNA ligase [Nakamurella sp. A5-74]|uniref:Tryptophan--tRNA ligase n=1 Tax=Nakamurella sp. A5-74 TaxID=3158264 RepID=A0AAU8DVX5_9ACTN
MTIPSSITLDHRPSAAQRRRPDGGVGRPQADELDAAIASVHGRAARVLTGDRPTGELHLGHYFGTLRNRVALQDAGAELIIVIADYQVITDRDGVGPLRERVLGLVADYLACGVDPTKSTIFAHSAVAALHQLMLPFLSLVSDAELRRNPTVKEELAQSSRPLSGLLLTYPVHQAADILFCGTDLVPVGGDQVPHLELARTIARRFNDRYGEVFTEPRALLSPTPRLLGTDGHKMSKSRGNTIPLGASDDETLASVRRAATDSERYITYAPLRRPGVSSLLDLAAACEGSDPRLIAEEIGNGGAAALKQRTAEGINELLRPLRTRRADLIADPGQLSAVLRVGAGAARLTADERLATVRTVMQMDY